MSNSEMIKISENLLTVAIRDNDRTACIAFGKALGYHDVLEANGAVFTDRYVRLYNEAREKYRW